MDPNAGNQGVGVNAIEGGNGNKGEPKLRDSRLQKSIAQLDLCDQASDLKITNDRAKKVAETDVEWDPRTFSLGEPVNKDPGGNVEQRDDETELGRGSMLNLNQSRPRRRIPSSGREYYQARNVKGYWRTSEKRGSGSTDDDDDETGKMMPRPWTLRHAHEYYLMPPMGHGRGFRCYYSMEWENPVFRR